MTSSGIAHVAFFALALVPGFPLGFALFGRRHLAGWISGALFGYVLTSLALWTAVRLGVPSVQGFAASWFVAACAAWLLTRRVGQPMIALPAWGRRDMLAWVALLLVTAAIAIPPLARAGASDAEGNRYYRAYFTADFAWHTALASEMAKFSMPPQNPYLAGTPIHYYWTYFLLPASIAGAAPRSLQNVEFGLKVNAVGTALLFVSIVFLAAWTAAPSAWAAGAAVALAIVASSAEGTYAAWRILNAGGSLAALKDLNIDALSNWWLAAPRIDGLQRCFWWVPQHSMAYALGLVALTITNAAGSGAPLAAIVLAGIALGGATLMNPFVGGIFSLAWGIAVAVDAVKHPAAIRHIVRHASAALPVILAVFWCVGNQMVEGAGGNLEIGWGGDSRHAPVTALLLSLGPALAPALVGVLATARARISGTAIALAGLSLGALYFVRLTVDSSWVGFRAGQMFLAAVPALTARGFLASKRWRTAAVVTSLVALLVGLPTALIDTYNAQDISNFSESPNGPWTVTITRAELDALEWIRRATPSGSIVQMDPSARDRQTWTLIPGLAQRRMAAGLPISLMDMPAYHEKSALVREMYATIDGAKAWDIAHRLGIEYVYVDRVERGAYPEGVQKFERAAEWFAPAFRNGEVAIYRVE